MSGADITYYDRPMLQQPVWIWTIPAYFFVGGAAGAAATLAACAQAFDSRELRGLIVRARWIGAVGGALSAVLLISDLGRKKRFLYMLRVFRPTSPMSVGSWVLAGFGGATASSAVLPGRLGNAAGYVAGLLGMPLASYTAVLIANTAVPVWKQSRRSLPGVFIGSGMVSAASLLKFLDLRPREARVVRAFSIAGGLMEIASVAAVDREARAVEQVGRALNSGIGGALWTAAKVLSAGALIIALLPGRSKNQRIAAGVAGSLASLCTRFALFYAGKRSARDPRASFHQQRQLGLSDRMQEVQEK